jgi:hypothetical protein
MILQIENGDVTLQKEEDILEHATEYYKNLLGPSEKPIFNLDPNCWDLEQKVTAEENETLTEPFSMKEIRLLSFLWR